MSEVDRLSNSGLYPALPIAEKRSRKDKDRDATGNDAARGGPPKPPPAAGVVQPPAAPAEPGTPRPPRSRIDEYA
ncbi:MAG TPA: hypothetical protein VMT50_08605 [Steroidobacteraceae bacterium]|nr:hypothetical protein [Steroidobacteraceae bacterium]